MDIAPKGTGVPFPAGSLVIMQVHYNLLEGDNPERPSLVLHTVPASEHLTPLRLDLLPAPPDIPCPAGITGPLCDRAASLADVGQRFGQVRCSSTTSCSSSAPGARPTHRGGDTTSCTWPAPTGTIVRLTAHMHLLGAGMKFVLDPGTPNQKTLLNITNYNFDYQRSYDITPITTKAGDTIQVTCTYNPTLRQQLPQLRKLPPRYVVWGDGSSDEMCLGLVNYVSTSNAPSI